MRRFSPNDLFTLVIGISMMIYGVFAVFRKEYDSFRYGHIDLGSYHSLIGLTLILLGCIICWGVIKTKG